MLLALSSREHRGMVTSLNGSSNVPTLSPFGGELLATTNGRTTGMG